MKKINLTLCLIILLISSLPAGNNDKQKNSKKTAANTTAPAKTVRGETLEAAAGNGLSFLSSSGDTLLKVQENGVVRIDTLLADSADISGTLRAGSFIGDGSALTGLPTGADDLGNHTAAQTLNLNGNYLSGDGDNEGVFIDVNGNTGVGTNTPLYPLQIQNSVSAITGDSVDVSGLTTVLKYNDNTNGNAAGLGFIADGNSTNVGAAIIHQRNNSAGRGHLHFATKNSHLFGENIPIRMTIRHDGKIGIGTTTPGKLLSVAGDADFSGAVDFNGTVVYNGGVTYSGNLGVGTEAPLYPLHVERNANALSTDSVNVANLAAVFRSPGNSNGTGVGIGFHHDANPGTQNTGAAIIYERSGSSGRGHLYFSTNNNSAASNIKPIRMTIRNNGNIGIGKQDPGVMLDVAGAARAEALEINGAAEFNGHPDSSGLIVNNLGDVGIGTNSPNHRLQVEGGGNAMSGDSVDVSQLNTVFRRANNTVGSAVGFGFHHDAGPAVNRTGAAMIFENLGSGGRGHLHFAVDRSHLPNNLVPIRMTINGDGNVGIGTTAPTNKLSVAGNADVDSLQVRGDLVVGSGLPLTPFTMLANGAVNPVGITQNSSSVGGPSTMEFTSSDAGGNQATRLLLRGGGDDTDVEIYSGAAGAEAKLLHVEGSNGRVGIGTGNPSSTLDVRGEISYGNSAEFNPVAYDRETVMVAGKVNVNAGIVNGVTSSGAITNASSGGAGIYTVTFAAGTFADEPIVTVTAFHEGSNENRYAVIASVATGSFTVEIRNANGNLANAPFNFIAIGER